MDSVTCRVPSAVGAVARAASSNVESATRALPADQLASLSIKSGVSCSCRPASPRSESTNARRMIVAMSSGPRGSRTTTRQRDSNAELTSNEGFSVVAPIKLIGAIFDRAQEGVLLGLVETMDLVDEEDRPSIAARLFLASSIAARTSRTPAKTADNAMNLAPLL